MDGLIAYVLAKKYADKVGREVLDAGFKVEVEDDRSILEEVGQEKILYLLPKESESISDGYDEYVYSNSTWEWIGHTDIDLSGYQLKITVDSKLESDLVDDSDQNHKFVSSEDKTAWNSKYDKPAGGIPSSDLDSSVQSSLGKADTAIQDISGKADKATTLSGYGITDAQSKIDDSHKLSSDLVDDTGESNKFVSTSEKSNWNSKYDKPAGGIPKTDLSSDVQTSLGKADTALQSETYTGTITGITMNGVSKGTSGVVDLGTVITEHQSLSNYATKADVDAVKATYKPFPATWNTAASNTIKYFCNVVDNDSSASEGMAFLGELSCSDFTSSGVPLNNGEAVVEVVADKGANGKVIHIVLTSGDTSPYRWEYTYWNKGSNTSGWVGFSPVINASNKLSSDFVDDTNKNNKFVSELEKSTWNAKYDKPSGGIPSSDLSSSVQATLGKVPLIIECELSPSGTVSDTAIDLTVSNPTATFSNILSAYSAGRSIYMKASMILEEGMVGTVISPIVGDISISGNIINFGFNAPINKDVMNLIYPNWKSYDCFIEFSCSYQNHYFASIICASIAIAQNKEDISNKVTAWRLNPDNDHYPSELLVKTSLTYIENNYTKNPVLIYDKDGNPKLKIPGTINPAADGANGLINQAQGEGADHSISDWNIEGMNLSPFKSVRVVFRRNNSSYGCTGEFNIPLDCDPVDTLNLYVSGYTSSMYGDRSNTICINCAIDSNKSKFCVAQTILLNGSVATDLSDLFVEKIYGCY